MFVHAYLDQTIAVGAPLVSPVDRPNNKQLLFIYRRKKLGLTLTCMPCNENEKSQTTNQVGVNDGKSTQQNHAQKTRSDSAAQRQPISPVCKPLHFFRDRAPELIVPVWPQRRRRRFPSSSSRLGGRRRRRSRSGQDEAVRRHRLCGAMHARQKAEPFLPRGENQSRLFDCQHNRRAWERGVAREATRLTLVLTPWGDAKYAAGVVPVRCCCSREMGTYQADSPYKPG